VTQALVLGNGESRKGLGLNQLKTNHTIIGCNAIIRDFQVDYLVCCDKRMADEANRLTNKPIYTRPEWMTALNRVDIFNKLPNIPYFSTEKIDQPINWGSGPYAVLLAAEMGFPKIVLAGFDLYSKNDKINNIYKGTEHYLPETAKPVDPAYWIHQIGQLMMVNPFVEFVVLNEEGWQLPEEWKRDNVRFQTIADYGVDIK